MSSKISVEVDFATSSDGDVRGHLYLAWGDVWRDRELVETRHFQTIEELRTWAKSEGCSTFCRTQYEVLAA